MPPGRRFGKYLLHEKLAVGGMGELYLATPAGAAKGTPPSVLKILLPEYSADADFVSMFHDEARIGMQLAHPNIVAVTDLGRVADTPFIVLEYVHGENLKSILKRCQDLGEKFPPELAVRIAIDALHGLDHAHSAKDARGKPINLVHRDLSPDNVMVSFEGDVKVLDFGIAKAEGRATQTQFGILKGKAQYMAPEQAVGGDVDARTDLYALALVLLEVITGERRFSTDTDPVQQIRDARVWKPYGPSERDRSLPVELDAILLKALQADPNRRWESAEEFSIALGRLLRDGKLPRSPENLPKFMRRLFPGRAEPFLGEDVTEGSAEGVLMNTGGRIDSPADPPPPLRVRARASAAAPVASDEPTSEGHPELTNDTVESEPVPAVDDAEPIPEDEGRTLIAPGRQLARERADERPTIAPKKLAPLPPRPPANVAPPPPPPPPRRLDEAPGFVDVPATNPAIVAPRASRLKPAIGDVTDEATNAGSEFEDMLGDGTRVGEFGGGTRVVGNALPRDRAREREREREREPRERETRSSRDSGANRAVRADSGANRAVRRDPSAGERRSRGGVVRARSGPPAFLTFVLVLVLLVVAAAAAALVFKEKLPPELRARVDQIVAKVQGGPAPKPGATTTPAATATGSATAVAQASPSATEKQAASPAPTETAVANATPIGKPTTARAVGGGVFPVSSDSSTPQPVPSETEAVAAATSMPAATPAPTAKTTPTAIARATTKPALTPVPRADATPRSAPVAISKDKAMVRIISKPAGFEILVDGVGTGKKTPGTVQVDPGVHTLSLKADGFHPWSFQEELHAGDTLQLPADLVPIPENP